MKIVYLRDYPEYVDTVVDWVYNEFVIKEGKKKEKNKIKEYFSNTNYDKFPICYIAIEEEVCLGTVSIFENDLKPRQDLSPWLGSLYVSEEHRGKGIAAKLINKVLEKVSEMGYTEVYLRTEHTADYYKKRNWSFVSDEVDIDGRDTEVYLYDMKYKLFQ
ncbi:MAG: GNAT family N-acetyltransferase [Halothermotrichaceae bacterium]